MRAGEGNSGCLRGLAPVLHFTFKWCSAVSGDQEPAAPPPSSSAPLGSCRGEPRCGQKPHPRGPHQDPRTRYTHRLMEELVGVKKELNLPFLQASGTCLLNKRVICLKPTVSSPSVSNPKPSRLSSRVCGLGIDDYESSSLS